MSGDKKPDRLPDATDPLGGPRPLRRIGTGLWALLIAAPALAQLETVGFKIFVAEDGVYRVGHDDLVAAGLDQAAEIRSDRLALTQGGEVVPIWIRDGGDQRFDAGDSIVFLGRHPAGTRSHYDERTALNVYRLAHEEALPAGQRLMTSPDRHGRSRGPVAKEALAVEKHLEVDRLRLRFRTDEIADDPEIWYWAKLTPLTGGSFTLKLDVSDYDRASERPFSLAADLRGWSFPRHGNDETREPDHRVEVLINGTRVASGEWQGQNRHTLRIDRLPDRTLREPEIEIELRVPKRFAAGTKGPIVDVSVLNWIELGYPRRGRIGSEQARLTLSAIETESRLALVSDVGVDLTVFGESGSRIESKRMGRIERDGRLVHFVRPGPDDRVAFVVPDDTWHRPVAVEIDRPGHLWREDRQADYIMIVHPRLREAIEPLAEHHRQRGLTVAVVQVDDVYDEWSHGLVDERAIRDFLAHAYHRWQAPAPRFVLLVGDASWDFKSLEADDENYVDWTFRPEARSAFTKNQSTPYATASELPHRNLIPTGRYETSEGLAASDNLFVAVDGDDFFPDMAIGRFPVTEPEEVSAIVAKTIRYAEQNAVGPWRQRALWITNEFKGYQMRSDEVAEHLTARGFSAQRVYPSAAEAGNEHHQTALRAAFDQGQILVHFFGHGGRYIWRTGPPDFRKNHDLFTLDDLDQLQPTTRLPMVVSMSCYSAPFDHPTADSIGEKFLRLGDRGAIAVLAASWRNMPSIGFDRRIVEELAGTGTIGEAIQRGKQDEAQVLVELYNLLGDPAVELAWPALQVALSLTDVDPPRVTARLENETFAGRALIEWLDADGAVLASDTLPMAGPSLELLFEPGDRRTPDAVRIYAWDEERRIDGIGRLSITGSSEAAKAKAVTTDASGMAQQQ